MAEGARLESVYAGNRIEGSNPSLSAFNLAGGNGIEILTVLDQQFINIEL